MSAAYLGFMTVAMFVLPALLVILFVVSLVRNVPVYDSFVKGAKKSFSLITAIFPCILAILIAVELFRLSGLSDLLLRGVSPLFGALGIPSEVCELVLLRPFTGSGSLAMLQDVYVTYGVDSTIARTASVIMGSSETVFYVASVYFSKTKVKRLSFAVPLALCCSLFAAVLASLVCRIL